MLYGLRYGFSGDFVEYGALCVLWWDAEEDGEVPGDGFAFSVFVCSEEHLLGLSYGLFQLVDDFFLAGDDDVVGLEVILDVYAEVFFGEVAYVSLAGKHIDRRVFEESSDGSGFGG